MPRVTEANEISKELRRGITFETKIMPVVTKARGMVSVVMVRLKFFTPSTSQLVRPLLFL